MPSSETQGQIVGGEGKSKRAGKYGPKKSKNRRSLLLFVPYFSARLDFPSPPLSAPESPRMASWVIRPRWREIRRFVLEFKARYFFLNSYIRCFLFEKSNLPVQRNNTLNLECKEVRDQFLENLDFPIHFL